MTDIPAISRQVLTLLASRCEAYKEWEVAFRSVLVAVKNPTAASTFFQQTTAAVAHKISTVSLALRNQVLPKLAADEEQQHQQKQNEGEKLLTVNKSSSSTSSKLLTRLIEDIQKKEKTKFESTVALQKVIMNHMRGENCAEFVHELNCAVYNFCFSFIGGSTLAKVTASASVLTRRRVEGEHEYSANNSNSEHQRQKQQIEVSDSDEEKNDGNEESTKKSLQNNQINEKKDDCDEVSNNLLELLSTIRSCEETISDATNEIQAIVSDS